MTASVVAVPDWLISKPIAHRGLHDASAGRVENSLSATRAAVASGFSIECDVQRSRDGEAMVFHDFTLERLTAAAGALDQRTSAELGRLTLRESSDTIAPLPVLLDAIGGRVPLICEIKSAFDGDMRLADRVAAIAGRYQGPLALKSFDPAVLLRLRSHAGGADRALPLGLVAEARYDDPDWNRLPTDLRERLAALVDFDSIRPDFLSYAVNDLPHAAATLFRSAWSRPVMCWTVRTPAQRERAARWADQMVFEGFSP